MAGGGILEEFHRLEYVGGAAAGLASGGARPRSLTLRVALTFSSSSSCLLIFSSTRGRNSTYAPCCDPRTNFFCVPDQDVG